MSHFPVSSFFFSPLGNKLALILIILVAVPILLLGNASLYLIDLAHRRDIAALEFQLLTQKEEEIEKYFADTLGVLELRVSFTQKSDIALSEQKFLLEGTLNENKAFQEVALLNLAGVETSKIRRGGEEVPLLNRSLLPYFREVAEGKSYVSSVYQTLEGPMLTIASPVYNRNEEIIQIIVAEVNLSSLVSSIESSRLGNEGYLVLLDSSDRVIASGLDKYLRGHFLGGNGRILEVRQLQTLSGLRDKDYYTSALSGVSVVGAGKTIQQFNWVILSEWPLSDAEAVLVDLRNQVLLLTAACIFSVLFLAPLLARRLTRPIALLREGVQRIERGDFSKELTIKTGDELEELGNSFNLMAKGLRQLEELRNEFVYVVTHELRAPITAIRGYVSMLRETPGSITPSAMSSVEVIWQSVEHLRELVHDLLDVARMEAGQFNLELKPVEITALGKEVVAELTPLANERGLSVIYFPKESFIVSADAMRVRQVLMNLLSNAIKYSNEAGTITLSHEREGSVVRTSVFNTGPGITPEEQPYMFEKYFRAKSQSKKIGTGLGLYITRQLVEKMGGLISFTSKKDEETVFFFTLPCVEKN